MRRIGLLLHPTVEHSTLLEWPQSANIRTVHTVERDLRMALVPEYENISVILGCYVLGTFGLAEKKRSILFIPALQAVIDVLGVNPGDADYLVEAPQGVLEYTEAIPEWEPEERVVGEREIPLSKEAREVFPGIEEETNKNPQLFGEDLED